MTVRCRCFAKINLGLEVGRRREDGFHELVTLYQTIDLFDELTLSRSRGSGLELSCDRADLRTDASNLVVRAYRHLARRVGKLPGVKARLRKRIPVGGGLGGGSSNAGAALLGLNQLLSLGLGLEDLAEVAAELGSDVPFFLVGGLALGISRGERVVPLRDLPRRHLVLVLPDQSVSTAEVFGRLPPRLTPLRVGANIQRFLMARESGRLPFEGLTNDLEGAAKSLILRYDDMVEVLEGVGADLALLSGSGSTVFGLFRSKARARTAAGMLSKYQTRLVRTLKRDEYRREVLGEGRP